MGWDAVGLVDKTIFAAPGGGGVVDLTTVTFEVNEREVSQQAESLERKFDVYVSEKVISGFRHTWGGTMHGTVYTLLEYTQDCHVCSYTIPMSVDLR